MRSKLQFIFAALLALLLWYGIFMQFYLSVPDYLAKGRTLGGAIVQLLSYFTIQNNMAVAILLTAKVLSPESRIGRYLSSPQVNAAMVVYITVVGLVYHFMLRNQFHPVGMFKLTSDIFHIVSPIAFVLFWLIALKKDLLKWSYVFSWLLYPLIYTIYILFRGAFTGYYPYNFIDAAQFGYAQVSVNCLFLLVGFLVFNLLVISISRALAKKQ